MYFRFKERFDFILKGFSINWISVLYNSEYYLHWNYGFLFSIPQISLCFLMHWPLVSFCLLQQQQHQSISRKIWSQKFKLFDCHIFSASYIRNIFNESLKKRNILIGLPVYYWSALQDAYIKYGMHGIYCSCTRIIKRISSQYCQWVLIARIWVFYCGVHLQFN